MPPVVGKYGDSMPPALRKNEAMRSTTMATLTARAAIDEKRARRMQANVDDELSAAGERVNLPLRAGTAERLHAIVAAC